MIRTLPKHYDRWQLVRFSLQIKKKASSIPGMEELMEKFKKSNLKNNQIENREIIAK